MTRIHILLSLLLFSCLCARAQKELVFSSLTRRGKVELRNFVNGKLINSASNIKKKAIPIQVELSDSIVFLKQGLTPVALLGVNILSETTIKVEIPELPEYTPYDTIHILSSSFNRKSNKFEDQNLVETPNNSIKLKSFPNEIQIRVNGITYTGILNTKNFNEVLHWDGNGSGTIFFKGIEAIYIVQLKD
jgi:hypothetical protein